MNRSRVIRVLAILALGCAFAACSKSKTPGPSDAPSTVVLGNGSDSGPGAQSVRVEIRPGVAYKQTMVSSSGAEAKKTATINGLPFEIQKTEIRIGSKSYGPIKAGDHVVIDADGVQINGVLNGPLP